MEFIYVPVKMTTTGVGLVGLLVLDRTGLKAVGHSRGPAIVIIACHHHDDGGGPTSASSSPFRQKRHHNFRCGGVDVSGFATKLIRHGHDAHAHAHSNLLLLLLSGGLGLNRSAGQEPWTSLPLVSS